MDRRAALPCAARPPVSPSETDLDGVGGDGGAGADGQRDDSQESDYYQCGLCRGFRAIACPPWFDRIV
jgi:hypothetical protein